MPVELSGRAPRQKSELFPHIAELTGMDASDPILCKALAYRITQAFKLHWKRKRLGCDGIR